MDFSDIIPFYPAWNFELFELINRQWSSQWLDWLLPPLRNKYFWLPFYVLIASWIVLNLKKSGWVLILVCGLGFALSNTISGEIMKPMLAQDRPCNHPKVSEQVILRVDCGPGKSFPSAHATNHGALGLLLGTAMWPYRKFFFALGLVWAGVVSYAQVYVGVHYPLDVLVGLLIGSAIGVALGLLWRKTSGFKG